MNSRPAKELGATRYSINFEMQALEEWKSFSRAGAATDELPIGTPATTNAWPPGLPGAVIPVK